MGATWFTITFEGEPTEADFARVSELAAGGYTSGQLLNEPGAEDKEGPATGYCNPPAAYAVHPDQPWAAYGKLPLNAEGSE